MGQWREMSEKLEAISKKVGVSMDKALLMLREIEDLEEMEEQERRATPEEIAKIVTTIEDLYKENPDLEITPEEIVERAGVRRNIGTLMTARWKTKKLALAFKKDAAE